MVKTHEKSRIRFVSSEYIRTYDNKKYVILQIEEFQHWYVVELVDACDYLTDDVDDLKLKLEFLEEEKNRLMNENKRILDHYRDVNSKYQNYVEFINTLKLKMENWGPFSDIKDQVQRMLNKYEL